MRKRLIAWSRVIGWDETLLMLGLLLMTTGLWPVLHCVALSVPGAVLLWIALPARARFVEPADPPALQKRSRA